VLIGVEILSTPIFFEEEKYMNCDCGFGCNNLQLVNATLVQGTSATLTVVPETFMNTCVYKLRYCVRFQDATGTEPLIISSGATSFPVLDRFGNPVRIGRLRRRELLCLRFSNVTNGAPVTVTPHFTLLNELFCQSIITPEVVAAAATAAVTE